MNIHTYHIESFGCQMNLSDSERIAAQLDSLECVPVELEEQADVIVLNTCCVRESAENRIFGRIGALKRVKQINPECVIIIAGCLAQKDQEAIFRRAPHVDIVLGTQNVDRLAEILQGKQQKRRLVELQPHMEDGLTDLTGPRRHTGVSAWIPVMYGCDNFCSYCIVPYVRGRERSRRPEAILEEAREFAAAGGREVTLLGQNVNSYGKNLSDSWNFPRLLSEVDQIPGIRRIRFMTSHPKDFGEELIQVMAAGKNICAHLHLPVQSGCDEILRRMNRRYTTAEYRTHVEKLRAVLPEVSLTTDLIVGFPGETDAMFEETLHFIDEMKFDAAFTFLYSKRSGTPAATLEPQVAQSVKQARLQQLMSRQNAISLQANERWLDRTVEVLADGPSKTDPAVYSGRTVQNKLVLWPTEPDDRPGVFRQVRLTSAQTFLLKGIAVSERNGMLP
ncbi:MAG: tRNA (N6-isopentenyl adenosine(37)-C2)-methylthiotransferase MiaB [Veillonellaceae bacterium]|nr:tRNA (N6-isopentenyl adenosine(37)-C2)-methylthiotransferase MiaB [Veillonellaceae bacterium]